MPTAWEELIDKALAEPPEEPDVRLLQERLSQGWRIVGMSLLEEPEFGYRLLLDYDRQLQPMDVRHSEGFTFWSISSGSKMATEEQEVRRWQAVLADRFKAVRSEIGPDLFNGMLLIYLRSLGAPETTELLEGAYQPPVEKPSTRVLEAMERVLGQSMRDLVVSLKYDVLQAASILDRAVGQYAQVSLGLASA